jgi:UrcA family protein
MSMKTSIPIELALRCLSLGVIGGALLGSPVFAATPPEPPSVRVTYGDLNLQSPAGIEALYKRIHRAATEVCDMASDSVLAILWYDRECAAATEAQAIEKVNNAALSAYYQKKVGGANALVAMSNGK